MLKGRSILVLPFFFFKSREPLHREVKEFAQVYTASEEFVFPASRAHDLSHVAYVISETLKTLQPSMRLPMGSTEAALGEPVGPSDRSPLWCSLGGGGGGREREAELGCVDRVALKPW